MKIEAGLDSELFRYFFDKATLGIKILDPGGIVIYANEAELDLFGFKANEFIGKHFSEFLPDKKKAEEFFDCIKRMETVEEFYTQLVRKDKSIIDVSIDVSVNCDDGGLRTVCCFTRDITGLKRNTDLLEFLNTAGIELATTYDTQSTLEKIVQLIVPGFANWFSIDVIRDGKIELLKLAHENREHLKLAWTFRTRNPITLEDDFGIGKVLRTGKPSFTPVVDELIRTSLFSVPDNSELLERLKPQSAIVVPMFVKDSITGAISFISTTEGKYFEVTDLAFAQDFANRIALALENARLYQEAQEEIKHRIEAEQKKDEFISMASHELKTPLTSIKAYTQILARGLRKDDKALQFINKASAHVRQLERLISDLLDVSKINAGKLTYNFSVFDFNTAIQDSVESVQLITSTHKIIVESSVSVFFKGDKLRIEQVIINFLTNAIKYSPNADKVVVNSRVDSDNILVSIQDFGIGIAQENLHKLFERFYRVDSSSMKYNGLGLGLFIAAEILHGHKGSFWIESTPDKGSTFYFCLPLNLNKVTELVDEKRLYQDAHVRIEYKENEQYLEAVWSGLQTFESVKKGGEIMLSMLYENDCIKVLNDNSKIIGTWSQASDDAREIWFPAIQEAGVRYFAWVLSTVTFSNLSAFKSINSAASEIEVQFFTSSKDAKDWLSSC